MSESGNSDVKNIGAVEDEREKLQEFTENFNQLELLETHRHLIPIGTQSCWSGQSEDEEDEQEKSEEWYQMQEKQLEKNPDRLLLWAAENNRLSTVQRLLSQNLAPVNVQDEDKYTPLHRASYSGHLDIVHELIGQGADIHALTVDGWTPLHSAWKKFVYVEPPKRVKEILEEELYFRRDECQIKQPAAVALEGIWSVKRNLSMEGLKPASQNRNSLLSQPKYYSRHGGIRR
uniref:Ankyrin repeat domain 49 n=1 Tax=Crocodylus porosus TaxID=8502 RepID=A0A7M4FA92_CROPO